MSDAPSILTTARECIGDRAAERDNDSERSAARAAKMFNAATRHELSEADAWLFMVCLKIARAQNGKKEQPDDYVDGAAYMALWGESRTRVQAARVAKRESERPAGESCDACACFDEPNAECSITRNYTTRSGWCKRFYDGVNDEG